MNNLPENLMTHSKVRRLSRLFAPDGKSLVVAMDHSGYMNQPLSGLERPGDLIRDVVTAGADALLLTTGSAVRHAAAIGRAGLWLSVEAPRRLSKRLVELALRAGADGIKCMAYPWSDEQPESMFHLAALAADCHAWGVPLMAEVVPGGFAAGPDMRTPERIAAGARIAMEAGADVIKTFYTGDPESFHTVVEYAAVPVVVLGGERAANDADLLQSVRGALDAGAAGVAIGRNIWQHREPARITAALAALVHAIR